jgi:phage antirepressor YoqD-like protein
MKAKNSKIPFRDCRIHVIKGENGSVDWINLHDVCQILKRQEMVETGEAIRICASSRQFPLYSNGKLFWFTKPHDLYCLLNRVRTDNNRIAGLCDELEKWLLALPAGDAPLPALPTQEIMPAQTEAVAFCFHDKPVSFKTEGGTHYLNATQMAHTSGRNPREWLQMVETKRFREGLVEAGISKSVESQMVTKRGRQGETWLEIHVAIEFARWLSPEFAAWCNDRIMELGIKVASSLDNLKKKPYESVQKSFPVPASFKEALQLAVAQQEEIERQQEVIEENRHKVAFYDEFIENRDWFKSTTLADELRITSVQLHRFLMEMKVCRFEKRQYVVHRSYSALQCEVPYLWKNKQGKTYTFGKVRRWTKAGREYIIDLWSNHHLGETP